MTDLRTLADAFAELERRADVAMSTVDPSKSGAWLDSPPVRRRRTWASHGWLTPVAAAAAVVFGVVAAAVALAPGGGSGTQPGTQTSTQANTAATTAPTTQPAPASTPTVPRDSAELATRFQTVLGDTATFTVTDTGPGIVENSTPAGAFLGGVLTASGVSGGYNLWFYPGRVLGECGDCTTSRLDDGSELWVHQMPLDAAPDSLTVAAELYRADGVLIRLFVSNASSPKGGDTVQLAAQPPLTQEQVIAILTSDRW